VDQSLWQEAIGTDAYKKSVRLCDRNERGVRAKKREDIPIVEERKREGQEVCKRTTEEEIHLAVQVTTNSASIL